MKSYVYAHVLPTSGEVIYIGTGQRERAWTTGKRSAPHRQVLENVMAAGFSPADYVVVLAQAMTESDARKLETALIKKVQPIMNQAHPAAGRGIENHNAVLCPERVRTIRADVAAGLSIRASARRQGVAYTTARKVIKGLAWSHVPCIATIPGDPHATPQ